MEVMLSKLSGAMHPSSMVGGVKDPKTQPSEDKAKEVKDHPLTPEMDEYIPEEKKEPTGRYWMERDGEGKPKIYFDDPQKAEGRPDGTKAAPAEGEEQAEAADQADNPDKKKAGGPQKSSPDQEPEICRGNTDKVEREIKELKKKRDELKQQLNSEDDEKKVKDLEKKLSQVEQELRQKDNDSYRRRNTIFSFS